MLKSNFKLQQFARYASSHLKSQYWQSLYKGTLSLKASFGNVMNSVQLVNDPFRIQNEESAKLKSVILSQVFLVH